MVFIAPFGSPARWPNARLETTTGLGHNRILRDSTAVASATAFNRQRINRSARLWGARIGRERSVNRGGPLLLDRLQQFSQAGGDLLH